MKISHRRNIDGLRKASGTSIASPRKWPLLLLPILGLALGGLLIAQARGLHAAGESAVRASGSRAAGSASSDAAESSASAGAGSSTASAIASRGHLLAEGRLASYPGAQVEIGTEIAGTLTRVLVTEKQSVRKGDLLAELRSDDLRAELSEARARYDAARADSSLARIEYDRMAALLAARAEPQQSLDRARRNLDAASAGINLARATVDELEARIAKTRMVAPIDGVILERAAEPGETVDPGGHLFTVADLKRTRVEAEVDEFDAGRIAVGAPVEIRAEGFEGKSWRGAVEEIPDRVIPRRLKPVDPARPGDTRVLLVKIAFSEATPLKLGQRVEVEMEAGR